jgi:hypothetical protein
MIHRLYPFAWLIENSFQSVTTPDLVFNNGFKFQRIQAVHYSIFVWDSSFCLNLSKFYINCKNSDSCHKPMLDHLKIGNILFLDIETVPIYPAFENCLKN